MPDIHIFLAHKADETNPGETGFWAYAIDQPGIVAQGETLEELRRNIKEALKAVLPKPIAINWETRNVVDPAARTLTTITQPWGEWLGRGNAPDGTARTQTAFEGTSNPPEKEA